MDSAEFEAVFEREVGRARETLIVKAREYAGDGDRLHNFKVSAAFQGISEEQALLGMLTKHLVSISDMVRKGKHYPEAVWDEKIGDAVNYLVLLRAQVFETDNDQEIVVHDTAIRDGVVSTIPVRTGVFTTPTPSGDR